MLGCNLIANSAVVHRDIGEKAVPSLEWNTQTWNTGYDWKNRGDEWSIGWGSSSAEWNFTLLPRIHRHLPAHTILEIAPGFGRWTRFLTRYCERLIGVDLSQTCADACRERFAAETKATFHVNDGYSLAMVEDQSIDFAFSFDSLVHAEWDVVSSYLLELARVLRPDGTAFIHHSNLAALPNQHNLSARAVSVSGEKVLAECARIGLFVQSQERVNWNTDGLSDCLTTVTRTPSECIVVENHNFMAEAGQVAAIAPLYADPGEPLV